MASVHERVSPRTGVTTWRVMFRIGTTQRQETFDDPESAYEFCRSVDRIGGAAALRVKKAKQDASTDTPTLRQFTKRYLDAASGMLTGIEPGTRKGYERSAELSFLPILGDFPIDAVQKDDIGRWVAWQESQRSKRNGGTIAAKTVKNYHSILSAVMSAAVDAGYRADNPAHRTRLTKGRRTESVFLTPEEFATLLHFIPAYHQRFVLFLAGTGCRWGEATAATWGDVNHHAKPPTVKIDKAWKKGPTGAPVLGPPKSARANRTISLTADVVAALGEPGSPDSLLFPGQLSGSHLWYGRFRTSTWLPAVKRAQDPELCAEAGLTAIQKQPTPHDLRHSHASWLIARGVPLPLIQARLGHESIQTTVNVYGHLQPDAHVQMADVMAATLAGVRPLRQLT